MPLTFLELVNSVSSRVNELQLTPENFSEASGFHANAKDSVNAALRRINHYDFTWPFNWAEDTVVLTPGVDSYPYPNDAKFVDFESFRVIEGDHWHQLSAIEYHQYLSGFYAYGDTARVFKRPGLRWGIAGKPKEARTVIYDYYKLPLDLEEWDDQPTVPHNYKYVIVDGAMQQVHKFLGDLEASMMEDEKFKEGRAALKMIYANDYRAASDTRHPGAY